MLLPAHAGDGTGRSVRGIEQWQQLELELLATERVQLDQHHRRIGRGQCVEDDPWPFAHRCFHRPRRVVADQLEVGVVAEGWKVDDPNTGGNLRP
jgi:hypothetical protein